MGGDYPGESVVRLDPATQRERQVIFVTDRSSRTPTLQRWIVRGAVADTTAWTTLDSKQIERDVKAYSWGQRVGFGITGDGEGYLTSGWSTTSPTVHWNDGPFAELTFAVPPPPRDIQLRFVFFAHVVPGKVDRQRVIIKVNGHNAGSVDVRVAESQAMKLKVPRDVLLDGRMVITFELPDAVSPKELGTGRDPRALAMGLYGFETTLIDIPRLK
jgi:hypothetical protein